MKLIPLFWSDFRGLDLKQFACQTKNGYRVLALDIKVVLFCVQNGISYTCIEDWLDKKTLYQCAVLAYQFEQSWFREHRDLFVSKGLCFPEIDSDAMCHFWRDTVAAAVFMEVFLGKGGRDILVPNNQKVPSVYYYRADTWKTIIENYAPEKSGATGMLAMVKDFAGDLEMTDSVFGDTRFEQDTDDYGRWERGVALSGESRQAAELKIAVAINSGEIGRFKPLIEKIQHLKWGRASVYLATHDSQQCEALTREWGISFFSVPANGRSADQLSETLYKAYFKTRNACFDRLGLSTCVDYHFRYYCEHRWPALFNMYRGWQILWERERPAAVIGSSLSDAESQLPLVAANNFGIETFGLPHARFQGIKPTQNSKHILYDFIPYRNDLEKIGIHPERLIGCRDVLGAHPYQTYRRVHIEKKALNILALVGNINGVVEDGDLFVPRVLSSFQIEALRCLANPPEELLELVQIKFKVHPMGAEMEMFELAGINADESLLPVNTDLHTALDSFDLVADINNTGTAVLTAIEREMPLLLWWNGFIKKVNYNVEVLLEAGASIANGRHFWHCVRQIIRDPAYRKKLVEQSKSFKDKYLNTDQYPTIERVMGQCLFEGGKRNRTEDASWVKLSTDTQSRDCVSDISCKTITASDDLLRHIAKAPDDVETLVDLALAAARDNVEDALAFLDDALILDPFHKRALSMKDKFFKDLRITSA